MVKSLYERLFASFYKVRFSVFFSDKNPMLRVTSLPLFFSLWSITLWAHYSNANSTQSMLYAHPNPKAKSRLKLLSIAWILSYKFDLYFTTWCIELFKWNRQEVRLNALFQASWIKKYSSYARPFTCIQLFISLSLPWNPKDVSTRLIGVPYLSTVSGWHPPQKGKYAMISPIIIL